MEKTWEDKYIAAFFAAQKRGQGIQAKAPSELGKGKAGILMRLCVLDKQTAGALGSFFNVGSARIAAMLNELERDGFIIREKDEKDRRISYAILTQKGEKAGEASWKYLQKTVHAWVDYSGEDAFYHFLELYGKYREISQELSEKGEKEC